METEKLVSETLEAFKNHLKRGDLSNVKGWQKSLDEALTSAIATIGLVAFEYAKFIGAEDRDAYFEQMRKNLHTKLDSLFEGIEENKGKLFKDE